MNSSEDYEDTDYLTIENLKQELNKVKESEQFYKEELNRVYATKSWRITKILRKMTALARRLRGENNCNSVELDKADEGKFFYRDIKEECKIPIGWLDILKNQYKFSIILALKNVEENKVRIKKAIKSCVIQDYKNIELLLLCTQEEKDILKELSSNFNVNSIKIICFKEDVKSLKEAWKIGLNYISGDYVGILEQEDYFRKDAFSYFMDILNENPSTKILSCYDGVEWKGDIKFINYRDKLDDNFVMKNIRTFSLVSKEFAKYLIDDSLKISEIIVGDEYICIPKVLYYLTPAKSDWIENKVRCLAFYLPQFHEIPENNEWWGQGFTEWTNVKKAVPLYGGHYQPRIPADSLGYYDLGDENGLEVQLKQMEMAKAYDISGFCYYYYWFDNGKRLLEKPLDRHLNNSEIDFPFCLCWANENWTRSWDGLNKDIIMPQTYMQGWERKFVEDLIPYFSDPRYIKVDGAPYLLIYNIFDIENADKSLIKIRNIAREHGIEKIHISAVRRTETSDELSFSGFNLDSLTDFPPHLLSKVDCHDDGDRYGMKPGHLRDYRKACNYHSNMRRQPYTYFRTAMLQWDNTARRGANAHIYENFSYDYFKEWLYAIKRYTIFNNKPDENLMFINAWNEWAEGTVLEPDAKNGFKALETTKEVLEMK